MHEILRAAGQPGLRHASAGTAGSRHPAGSLPTAPLLAGGTPVQLGGGGVAPGPFPAMGDAPASALLHWGARPEALVAPAMLAGPAGWFVPVPTQGPGAQGGYLLQPSMMMGPTGMYLPYAQPGEAAGAAGARADAAYMDGSHDIAATSLDPAAGESASGGLNGGTAEQHSMGEPAEQEHDQGAAAAAAYAREEGLEVPADSALQPAEGADLQEQCDVAASWPPYKGAKLPPLRQARKGGAWMGNHWKMQGSTAGSLGSCPAQPTMPAVSVVTMKNGQRNFRTYRTPEQNKPTAASRMFCPHPPASPPLCPAGPHERRWPHSSRPRRLQLLGGAHPTWPQRSVFSGPGQLGCAQRARLPCLASWPRGRLLARPAWHGGSAPAVGHGRGSRLRARLN